MNELVNNFTTLTLNIFENFFYSILSVTISWKYGSRLKFQMQTFVLIHIHVALEGGVISYVLLVNLL